MTENSPQKPTSLTLIARYLSVFAAFILGLILAAAATIGFIYLAIALKGNALTPPHGQLSSGYDCIIVPGAQIYANKRPSPMLQDRLDGAVQLYRAGVSDRILVSGDHREDNYNEPLVMFNYLLEQGIPEEHIFMDHYGLDTYDTIYRARDVFQVGTAVIATQRFHLQRALYIAEKLDLSAWGYATDPRFYSSHYFMLLRELGARLKAVYEIRTGALPAYSSPPFPFEGDGRLTHDPF